MHSHLIDWFRNVHIHPDPKVVEKRWDTAAKYSENLSQSSICMLLRLFLFPVSDSDDKTRFEKELLDLDVEFPIAGNDHELRLMAGVVMTVTFDKSSYVADAFSLGLTAATALGRQVEPAQPEILQEAECYLSKEAEDQRPDNFGEESTSSEVALNNHLQKLTAATGESSVAAQSAFFKEIIAAFTRNREASDAQLLRLSEESAMLWWLINEYSDSLQKSTPNISALDYAIAAAVEASRRTLILPPPNSMGALLTRALKPCRAKPQGPYSIEQLLVATNGKWRTPFVHGLQLADSKALLPIMTEILRASR